MRQYGHPSGGPQAPVPPRGSGQSHWVTAFAGFAVGLVLATFAWVGVLPGDGGTGGDAGEFVLVGPGEELPGEVEGGVEGAPRTRTEQRVISEGGDGSEGSGASGGVDVGGGVAGGTTGGGGGGGGGTGPGDTTTGVTDSVIKLGATVAEDGIAEAFLGEVRFGMEAVRGRVNRGGGVHDRQLEVIYRDDAWDATRGQTFIQNFIQEEKVFALAVSPSSEGLNAASDADVFRNHRVPVIGADGLNNTQFLDPWIWPVAAATTTQVHIILRDAAARCRATSGCDGLRPAIVFGNTYRFGREGAYAFNGAYCRETGGTFTAGGQCNGGQHIPGFKPPSGGDGCERNSRFCGISADSGQYGGEISRVKSACADASIGGGRCNFILMLLEPATALQWMGGDAPSAADFEGDGGCCGMAGAQPLFTRGFAGDCGDDCNRMMVWTGYNPPIGRYANNPDVAKYVEELDRASQGQADKFNQFTMGGYIGMSLLVEALDQVGRDLTRERLVDKLNSMAPLQTGLTNPDGLRWTAERRYANDSAQSFRIDYRAGTFNGFQPEASYTEDPWLGQDNVLPE